MATPDTIELLNRVLALLRRSFPQFMRYARPYFPPGREDAMNTIGEIAASQDALAERVSQTVSESGGLADAGKYPLEFTDTHDLGIDFLIQQAIGYQQQDIGELQQIADALRHAPTAQSLAAEALGMAKAHLEALQALAAKTSPSTIVRNGAPAFDNE